MRALPVVAADGTYLGMAVEDHLLDEAESDLSVMNVIFSFKPLKNDTHVFDILKVWKESALTALPVIDEQGAYMGAITYDSLVRHLTNESSAAEPGGIIVLEMKAMDYSMAEIARIVESNHAVILHSYVTPRPDRERILVTLKLNKMDLKEVLLTFERFEYHIVAVFHVSEYEQGLQDRYESLMMYLSI